MRLYDVKMPMVTMSKRVTFVIGTDGKIVKIDEGKDAINADSAAAACKIAP